MIRFYGLKNCDSCRRARTWLDARGIASVFHDIREDAPDEATIAKWAAKVGWETLLNRRGTTWRGLPEASKAAIDEASAIRLMTGNPVLIKRPVMVDGEAVFVGFDPDVRAALESRG